MAAGMVSSVWLKRKHSTVKLYYKLGHAIVCFIFKLSPWICDLKTKKNQLVLLWHENISVLIFIQQIISQKIRKIHEHNLLPLIRG